MGLAHNKYLFAADVMLLVHFTFVAFVVIGLVFIWIGYFAKFKFVRNAIFRICHILAMGFIVCENLVGMICPLTEWEYKLRINGVECQAYEIRFMK